MNVLVMISNDVYRWMQNDYFSNDEWILVVLRAAEPKMASEETWERCQKEIVAKIPNPEQVDALYALFHVSEVLTSKHWPKGEKVEDRYEALEKKLVELGYSNVIIFGFHTVEQSTIWQQIKQIERLNTIGMSVFAENVLNVLKKLIPEKRMEHLSALKHRIAHLFLSMELNLLGIDEEWRYERNSKMRGPRKSLEYLRGVLQDAQNMGNQTYFCRKLADLQYYVGKLPNKYRKDDDQNIKLPEGKSVVDLLNDSKEAGSDIEQEKETLFSLSGIENIDGTLRAKDDSLISRFMELLDKRIIKIAEANENTIDGILGYFTEPSQTERWKVGSYTISSFHDWFCALMNILNTLRQKLEPKRQAA